MHLQTLFFLHIYVMQRPPLGAVRCTITLRSQQYVSTRPTRASLTCGFAPWLCIAQAAPVESRLTAAKIQIRSADRIAVRKRDQFP